MNTYTRKQGRYEGPGDPLAGVIAGTHARKSPYQWLPESQLGQSRDWKFYDSNTAGFAQSATEGAAAFKVVLENSGTLAMTSAVVGSEGALLSTTGAADNNANHGQLCLSFLPAANRIAVAITRVILPATPAATIGDLYFGFWNTAADPVDSAPTHGAYFAKDDGAATAVGRTKDGTTSTDTAVQFTSAISVGYDLGVVLNGTASAIFYWKLSTDADNAWNQTVKTTNLPTLAQRLSFAHQNGSGASRAVTWDRFIFASMRV